MGYLVGMMCVNSNCGTVTDQTWVSGDDARE